MKAIATAVAIAITIVGAGSADAQVTRKQGRIVFERDKAPSAYLGLSLNTFQQDSNGTKLKQSVTVHSVAKNSPAEKAGVKVGDEIISTNGMPPFDANFGPLAIGDTVELRIRREGKERDVTIVAEARPAGYGNTFERRIVSGPDSAGRSIWRFVPYSVRPDSLFLKRDSSMLRFFRDMPRGFEYHGELSPGAIFQSFELGGRAIGGAEFSEMDPALAEYFNGQRGLLTLRVVPETPADRAGLQPGDVILKAKDRTVQRVSDLRAIVAANPEAVKLEISRKGQLRTIELKTRR
ncbi:MAG: PDZ domain-containing protein [Gemmatimonadota bacterium]